MGQVLSIQKPIEKLVLEIRAHVHDAGRAENTCAKHQLQAGMRLVELRTRIIAGEAGAVEWWNWYETQFTGHIKSRSYAEKLMRWARADDPDSAMEADKAQQRQAMQNIRERGQSHVRLTQDQKLSDDIVERALRLVAKMTANEREQFNAAYQERFQ